MGVHWSAVLSSGVARRGFVSRRVGFAALVVPLVPSWDCQHSNDYEQDACRNHPRAAHEPADPGECSASDEEG